MIDIVLNGLFDYAGMFPPASLSFQDALHESAQFPARLRRPGLVAADMVLTPQSLAHLTPDAIREAGFDQPVSVCLVGLPLAQVDPALVARFNQREDAQIVSVEATGTDAEAAAKLQQTLSIQLYLEPRWTNSEWQANLGTLPGMLQQLGKAGLKFRCAGDTALEHDTVAAIIMAVAAHPVPLKATQGLHHPVRMNPAHENPHGFLNLLVALRLHQALALDKETILEILEETDEAAFLLDGGISWRHRRAMMQKVAEAASKVPFSIGSCSLMEPDVELSGLFGTTYRHPV